MMQLYASRSCLAEAQRKLRRKKSFGTMFCTWDVSQHPVSHVAGYRLQCWGLCYALCSMWMACPDQDGTLQGQRGVSCNDLADDDPGTGSGWQQNKQNCTVPSVVG